MAILGVWLLRDLFSASRAEINRANLVNIVAKMALTQYEVLVRRSVTVYNVIESM